MRRMPYRGGSSAGGEIAGGQIQQAKLALMNNQPARAEEICRRRLEKKPDEIATRLLLAQALIQMQRAREGVNETRRVLEAQPNSVDALLLLSDALMQTNQVNPPKEALTAAERAVELKPREARTHVQLAMALLTQRDFTRASEEAEEAVRLEPRLAAAHYIKGMALLNNKDYEGAAEGFRAALRQDKSMAGAHFGLAQALSEMKDAPAALDAVNTAQQMNPLIPTGQVVQLRAQIYRKQRNYRQAYNEYLTLTRTTGGRNQQRFAPLIAAFTFFLSFFGRGAQGVLVGIVFAVVFGVLFGVSKIPFAGGAIVDLLIVGLFGYLGWQVTRQYTGTSPVALLANSRVVTFAVAALVAGVAIVFGIAALIGRGQHHNYWFNPVSFAFAAAVGLIAGWVTLNTVSGSARS